MKFLILSYLQVSLLRFYMSLVYLHSACNGNYSESILFLITGLGTIHVFPVWIYVGVFWLWWKPLRVATLLCFLWEEQVSSWVVQRCSQLLLHQIVLIIKHWWTQRGFTLSKPTESWQGCVCLLDRFTYLLMHSDLEISGNSLRGVG